MAIDIRVSCFLCRCYAEVSQIIDLDALKKEISRHPLVDSCEIWDSLCLLENIEELAKRISESGTDKILLAACSPLARGDVILHALERHGIDPASVELVDIREGCAWIHNNQPKEAMCKARDLINMGLSALKQREVSENQIIVPKREVLIIGAGPAGMSAAVSLARLGFAVHVLDRARNPGGLLNLLKRIAPEDIGADESLLGLHKAFKSNALVHYYPGSRLISSNGSVGDFVVEFKTGEDTHSVRVGTVIIASGARVMFAKGLYRYTELDGVVSGIELERRFLSGDVRADNVVFIQCVGVRDVNSPYCSTICCPVSLKHARQLKEINPQTEITILHRDIMCPGSILEAYYRDTMQDGVKFVRFDINNPPSIIGDERLEGVKVFESVTGNSRTIRADLVVLSSALVPHDDAARIAEIFDLALDPLGFYQVRTLMHPLETTRNGIFVCGSARWPVLARTAIVQGEAVAMKAFALLSQDSLAASGMSQFRDRKIAHAIVDRDACTGCGNCVAICPYVACALEPENGAFKSRVDIMRCTGCGSCVAVCPNGSIQLPEQNARVIGAMLKNAFS